MYALDGVVEDYYDTDGLDEMKLPPSDDMHYFDVNIPSVSDVWDHCMYPSIVQVWDFLSSIFLWNIAFRLLSQTGKSVFLLLLTSSISIRHTRMCHREF